uniref:DUF192 domain-containing protein n=1 Tax=Desulfobacca acetoxidans TaxID=60893 RepID=A0A7C5EN67_9BACT
MTPSLGFFRTFGFFLLFWLTIARSWGQEYSEYGNPLVRLTVKGVPVLAEVVSTPQKHYLGLSHRRELPEGRGMLFLMSDLRYQVFCMRDMLFPIDIIWIHEGKVAGLHKNLSPGDTGNYRSPVPVRLVLEVPGGFAERHGIKAGDPVVLELSGF